MSRYFTLNIPSLRRAALASAIALAAAAAFAANVAPAAAFGHGGFRVHGGFHNGFHHRFFAFGGPGYVSGYPYDDYGVDGGCLRRVWGPYGWRMINVCY